MSAPRYVPTRVNLDYRDTGFAPRRNDAPFVVTVPGTKFRAYAATRDLAEQIARGVAKTYIPARLGHWKRHKAVPVIEERQTQEVAA